MLETVIKFMHAICTRFLVEKGIRIQMTFRLSRNGGVDRYHYSMCGFNMVQVIEGRRGGGKRESTAAPHQVPELWMTRNIWSEVEWMGEYSVANELIGSLTCRHRTAPVHVHAKLFVTLVTGHWVGNFLNDMFVRRDLPNGKVFGRRVLCVFFALQHHLTRVLVNYSICRRSRICSRCYVEDEDLL